jgi:carbohydrate-selective porin OprB
MTRFRRIAAAAALLTLLAAAAPAPAAAAPWMTGFGDVGTKLQRRVVLWVLRHVGRSPGMTNTTAAEGTVIVP